MAKRFIIHEKIKNFELEDKKDKVILMTSENFDEVFSKAKEISKGEQIYGITHIGKKDERHPKFKEFKTPKVCSYELN